MSHRTADTDDLSPEQLLVVGLLKSCGMADAEDIVRSDRMTAYALGALLQPMLEELTRQVADLTERINDLVTRYRLEDRQP